jgi:hypothetical protein
MNAIDLLLNLEARGVILTPRARKLVLDAPVGALTETDRHLIRRLKPELLSILINRLSLDGPPADQLSQRVGRDTVVDVRGIGNDDLVEALIEAREERLSICTADGGLTLADAEVVALQQLRNMLDSRTSTRYT